MLAFLVVGESDFFAVYIQLSCSVWRACSCTIAFALSLLFRKAFELLKEVQSRGEKALVFSQFTTFLDVVEEALQLHLPTLRFCRLDGSTVVEERQRLVDGFNQTGDCTAFLLSTKAGGQGLNLTAARTVILLDQVGVQGDQLPQNDETSSIKKTSQR